MRKWGNRFLTDFLVTCNGYVFYTVNLSMQLNYVDKRRDNSYYYLSLFGVRDRYPFAISSQGH